MAADSHNGRWLAGARDGTATAAGDFGLLARGFGIVRRDTDSSAAAPWVAFPAGFLAAARDFGNITDYLKAEFGEQGAG